MKTCWPHSYTWTRTLKGVGLGLTHPKASMANGYAAEEALGFCTEYLNLREHTQRHIWENAEEESTRASIVEGTGRVIHLSKAEIQRAHEYVISHHGRTEAVRRSLVVCCTHHLVILRHCDI